MENNSRGLTTFTFAITAGMQSYKVTATAKTELEARTAAWLTLTERQRDMADSLVCIKSCDTLVGHNF